jgi:hypothetical protein
MTSFVDCARKHQTRFRDTSPTISKRGRTPSDAQGTRYGHLLAIGCEEEIFTRRCGIGMARAVSSVSAVSDWTAYTRERYGL